MYIIPANNLGNQTFDCTVPINGQNVSLRFNLWYNLKAEYWLLSVTNLTEGRQMFSNLPLLLSRGKFLNILAQLDHLKIGQAGVLPRTSSINKSMPSNTELGSQYVLYWRDNDG